MKKKTNASPRTKTAPNPFAALPYVHDAYIEDHRTDNLRSGEGCIEPLADGRLMFIYGKFVGGSDHDHATVVRRFSSDGGITWTAPEKFISTPRTALNDMSLSTLRLHDGRIAVLVLRKQSLQDCRPHITFSSDEGKTWTKLKQVITKENNGYYVVNNDRLVQLKSGRLLIPFAAYGDISKYKRNEATGCVYSDNAGETWHIGPTTRIEPKNVSKPLAMNNHNKEAVQAILKDKHIVSQEPGVIELSDGRVMMWCRTDGGYMYQAFSKDGGVTFSPYKAMKQFAMPCGPQSIKTIPGTNRLVMLYNDRQGIPVGDLQFHWRRTLNVAVSDDDAKTWHRIGLLEDLTMPSTCYYSICFHAGNMICSYYAGNMATWKSGYFTPDNLRSLKIRIIKQSLLKQKLS